MFLQHIVKCHGNTLLPQFLGMYRVSVDNEETYLLVMRNMFSHRLLVHRKYDLKVRKRPRHTHLTLTSLGFRWRQIRQAAVWIEWCQRDGLN